MYETRQFAEINCDYIVNKTLGEEYEVTGTSDKHRRQKN